MVIGVCHLELFLHENFSLKGKRQVLQSLVQRARKRFNISISEVDATGSVAEGGPGDLRGRE